MVPNLTESVNGTASDFNVHISCSAVEEHDHFSSVFTAFIITWLVIILLADLIGNTLVIIVILKNPIMRDRTQTTNYFLLNLAIADLLVAFVIPFSIHSTNRECWDLPIILCKGNSFLVTLSLLGSIYTLISMSIHKFINVRRVAQMNSFNNPVKRKTSILMILAVWAYAFVFSVLTVISDPIFKEKTLQCGPRYPIFGNKTFFLHIGNQVFNLFIPLVILLFCYTKIFVYIRHHSQEQRNMSVGTTDVNNSQGEQGVTLTLVIVLACFLLSWLPYIVYTNYAAIVQDKKNDIPYYLNPLAYCFGYMNSACNPLIYAWRIPRFRQGYKDIFNRTQYLVTVVDGGRRVRRPVTPSMIESEAGRRLSAARASVSDVRISSSGRPSLSELGIDLVPMRDIHKETSLSPTSNGHNAPEFKRSRSHPEPARLTSIEESN